MRREALRKEKLKNTSEQHQGRLGYGTRYGRSNSVVNEDEEQDSASFILYVRLLLIIIISIFDERVFG